MKQDAYQLMVYIIHDVIDGNVTEQTEIPCCRPSEVIDYFQTIGGSYDENWDCNGWQMDYWIKLYDKDGNTYQISGDGYYNSSCWIEKIEE